MDTKSQSDLEYPRVRYVEVFPVETNDGHAFGLRDPSGISTGTFLLSPDIFYLLQFFDGKHSLLDLRSKYYQSFGQFLGEEKLLHIVENLEAHLFLQNETFVRRIQSLEEEFRTLQVRPAMHAGTSYESDPTQLRKQIDGFFASAEGAGFPKPMPKNGEISGLMAPHIDVQAGGPCYSHAYRALAESTGADCFVILGTGHSGLANLYSTLAKDFDTPFGVAQYDREFLDLLNSNYAGDTQSEILAHKAEHTIEFQLTFLKYLYGNKRKFTFVPILCSFSYHVLNGDAFSREKKIVETFTTALENTISHFGKKVCVIASVDLSHVGSRYGDQTTPDEDFMTKVHEQDRQILNSVEQLDVDEFYRCFEKNQDRYRVCGFSPIYTLLRILHANEGKLLKYSNTVVDQQNSVVTFASMVFR